MFKYSRGSRYARCAQDQGGAWECAPADHDDEAAQLWLRHRSGSALSRWFQESVRTHRSRLRRKSASGPTVFIARVVVQATLSARSNGRQARGLHFFRSTANGACDHRVGRKKKRKGHLAPTHPQRLLPLWIDLPIPPSCDSLLLKNGVFRESAASLCRCHAKRSETHNVTGERNA